MSDLTRESVLEYHKGGKVAVRLPRPLKTKDDLCLAYTPGVAHAVKEIAARPAAIYDATAKGNLVAVVSDGTAILGLGDLGAAASIPVMEGKAVLFKHFADIDAIPVCLNRVAGPNGRTDPEKLIAAAATLEPSFGGFNLEDIAAPACFKVERTLKKMLSIPVFHDDQHGTAIISLAAILNGLEVVGKKIGECRFVVNGVGAAGLACSRFYLTAGAKLKNMLLCDSKEIGRAHV